ncbi:S49 family peptidase [Sandaracinus amylolyticus]|uniref:Peptidase S49 n=1 Tax=Sandaracinus amylolyticus TaxID=927083 RepID=A0A0F6W352_9BACT|nr:S49 family peptidase [Sandaracinus amylolyticus]AKF06071.1 Peptidase S49 [Sandaracinus amylolyticus]
MIERRYEPHGPLALEPSAFGMLMMLGREPVTAERRDEVSIVPIRGPLMHHRDPLCESYDDIKALVAQELAAKPRALVLRIDSPGGLVAGCFSTAREIRAMAQSAGVRVYAYVDGSACSAAYALACAAEKIVVPEAGMVGSIGVRVPLVDATQAQANQGLRVTMVSSGARKADGDPTTPFSEAALRATRETVESLAKVFFAWVMETRGVDEGSLAALEGAQFTGRAAVALGLADEVSTFEDLLASIASGQRPASAGEANGEDDMNEEEKARAALKAIVDGDGDEKAKAKARKALAAIDDKDDEEAAAPPPPDPKKDDEGARAPGANAPAAASTPDALSALAEVHKLRAEIAAKEEAAEREKLIASRPDFAPELVAALANAPMATVREMVTKLPRGTVKNPAAAAATVQPTRGEGQGDGGAPRLAPEAKAQLDAAMGLLETKPGVVSKGNKLVLGAAVPVKGA